LCLIQYNLVLITGDGYVPAGFFADIIAEVVRTLRFAVNDEDAAGRGFEICKPVEEFVPVGVCGETLYPHDFGPYRIFAAEYPDVFISVDDLSAEGAYGLVADEHYSAFWPGDIIDEVVFDSAAGAHTGACDDHNGSFYVVDGLRFFCGLDHF